MALALQQALDALEDVALLRAQRVVLISPMTGVTSLAGAAAARSHHANVAEPFPPCDGLYGGLPDKRERYGVALVVGLTALIHMPASPFDPHMMAYIEEGL